MTLHTSRHNLRDEPQVYVSNKTVNDFLQKHGADALPITLVDGEIAVSQTYPTTKQMSEWTGRKFLSFSYCFLFKMILNVYL